MTKKQLNQTTPSRLPILDAGLETRLLASEFVTEVRKSPGHVSFTMTDHGLIEFVKAWNLARVEESLEAKQDTSISPFPDNDSNLITKKEAMLGFRVSHTTLWKWQKTGYLTPVKVGKKVYYRREDIMSLTK